MDTDKLKNLVVLLEARADHLHDIYDNNRAGGIMECVDMLNEFLGNECPCCGAKHLRGVADEN